MAFNIYLPTTANMFLLVESYNAFNIKRWRRQLHLSELRHWYTRPRISERPRQWHERSYLFVSRSLKLPVFQLPSPKQKHYMSFSIFPQI